MRKANPTRSHCALEDVASRRAADKARRRFGARVAP